MADHDEHEHGEHDHNEHEHDHDEHEHGHAAGHAHDWQAELEGLRHEARHYFLHGFDWRGHAPPEDFEGPRWYAPAPDWRLVAHLDRGSAGAGDQVTLPTSTGLLRQMTVAGQMVFSVAGREQRLTAYRPHVHEGHEGDQLFVPFRDTTSGGETYGSGRYMDLPYDEEVDDYELDFNYAYNPSCAFSPAYDCPFPPPGNRLDVAVTAGEMVPFDH